ncbi:MAG: integrating conjugative element protein [Pseudomonadota bacterium]
MITDRTNHRRLACAMALLASIIPTVALGQQPTVGTGSWYYSMGGAAPISPAPNINAATFTFGGAPGLQLPKACGSLDPVVSIGNTLGQISDGFDQLDELLVLAATEAIAALPAIILQRANPGLYEHFQGALSSAKQLYDISIKSCERIVEDSVNGRNPFEDWVAVARRGTYQRLINEDDADAVAAEEEVATTNGNEGFVWIDDERRAGIDQDPVEVIREVVQAGYNLILGQPVTSEGAPPVGPGVRLPELFPTPADAGEFAVTVLGDQIIQVCEGCSSTTTSGVGLAPSYAAERQVIDEELAAILAQGGPVDLETLENVSAASVAVTPQLISTLSLVEDAQDRAVLIGRLAGDIATARTVEQALSVRRLLYSGRKVPQVSSNANALAAIDSALEELEREINAFMFEARIQKELVSDTAAIMLREGDRLSTNAAGVADAPRDDLGGVFLRGEVQ